MREIEITINADGTQEIDLKGYQGKGCSKVTEELIKALAGEPIQRTKKADFFKVQEKAKVKQGVRNG